MDNIAENNRLRDVIASLKRCNYKSASKHSKFIKEAILKEIESGLMLPLKTVDAIKLPNLEFSPIGVAEYLGVNNEGKFIPKERLTHDLSFSGQASNKSLNSRIHREELEPCMFGHTHYSY